MSIRKIKRYFKLLLLIVAAGMAAIKGEQLLPQPGVDNNRKTPQQDRPVGRKENVSLKDWMPHDNRNRTGLLLYRKNYALSYNKETLCPNWVLWELTREKADGNVKRPDYAFHEDMEAPAPRAELADYRGSGYDRGHMCPAGDNKWDEDAMYESFLLTNICPQNQQLNSGLWNQIEMACRGWAKKYGSLYIVCGPIYLNTEHHTIGHNQVVVPEAFFKAVVCLEGEPKGIAFLCRNTKGDRKKDYYVNTIRQVERITGYTLFPNLPDDITPQVKDKGDISEW